MVGSAAVGLEMAFVTIPANTVIALLTSWHPPESVVTLKSVNGVLVVYVPTGRPVSYTHLTLPTILLV